MSPLGAVAGEARALAALVAEFRQAVVPAIAEISPTFRAVMAAAGIIASGSNELSGANQNDAAEFTAAGLIPKEFLNPYRNDAVNYVAPEQLRNFLSICNERGVVMSGQLMSFLSNCAERDVNVPYDFLVACAENPDIILQNDLYSRLVGKFEMGQPVPNEIFIKVMNSVLGVEDAASPTAAESAVQTSEVLGMKGIVLPQITSSQADVNGVRVAQMGVDHLGKDRGGLNPPDFHGGAAPNPEDPLNKKTDELMGREKAACEEFEKLDEIASNHDDQRARIWAQDKRWANVYKKLEDSALEIKEMDAKIAEVQSSRSAKVDWTEIDNELNRSIEKFSKDVDKAVKEIEQYQKILKDRYPNPKKVQADYNKLEAYENDFDIKIIRDKLIADRKADYQSCQDAVDAYTSSGYAPKQFQLFLKAKETELASWKKWVEFLEQDCIDVKNILDAEARALKIMNDSYECKDALIKARGDALSANEGYIRAVQEWVEAVENTPLPKESIITRFWHLLGW